MYWLVAVAFLVVAVVIIRVIAWLLSVAGEPVGELPFFKSERDR